MFFVFLYYFLSNVLSDWQAIIEDENKNLSIISIFQIINFDPVWRTSNREFWPDGILKFKDEDMEIRKGTIRSISSGKHIFLFNLIS